MITPLNLLQQAGKYLNYLAGAALTFMMLLTVGDVLLRTGGRPIVGTYEIVALTLAAVIGFGIPQTSLDRGHINMDFLLEKLPLTVRRALDTATRLICFSLFALIGYNLLEMGASYRISGEMTATVRLPFYPVAYGLAFCCFLECLVFLSEIARIWRKPNE